MGFAHDGAGSVPASDHVTHNVFSRHLDSGPDSMSGSSISARCAIFDSFEGKLTGAEVPGHDPAPTAKIRIPINESSTTNRRSRNTRAALITAKASSISALVPDDLSMLPVEALRQGGVAFPRHNPIT